MAACRSAHAVHCGLPQRAPYCTKMWAATVGLYHHGQGNENAKKTDGVLLRNCQIHGEFEVTPSSENMFVAVIVESATVIPQFVYQFSYFFIPLGIILTEGKNGNNNNNNICKENVYGTVIMT